MSNRQCRRLSARPEFGQSDFRRDIIPAHYHIHTAFDFLMIAIDDVFQQVWSLVQWSGTGIADTSKSVL